MASTQRLRAVVTLGGSVDSSLGNLTRQFEQQARRMGRETNNLERQQERLTNRIRQAVLAGKDVSKLTAEYQRLSRRVRSAADETARLDRLTERASTAHNRLNSSMRGAAYTGGGLLAGGAALTGLMTLTNHQTTEMDGIAKSYDMTLEQYQMWDGIAKRMGDGFDGTKIGDMMEELGNKTGEFGTAGEMKKYEDAIASLNLDPKKLDKLTGYDRFTLIMSQLDKVKDKSKAQFAADEIFGSDSNRIITFLKNSGMSFDEIIKKQKKLNLLTDEGRDGAVIYGEAIRTATTVFGSAWKEIAGIIGKEVAPIIEETSLRFAEWFKNDENKKQLVADFKSFGLTLYDIGRGIASVGGAVGSVVETFHGWENTIKIFAGVLATTFAIKAVAAIGTLVSMGKAIRGVTALTGIFNATLLLNPLTWVAVGLAGLATFIVMNWEKVVATVFSSFDSIGRKWKEFKQFIGLEEETTLNVQNSGVAPNGVPIFDDDVSSKIKSAAPANSQTVNQTVGEIKVYASPGQSPQEIAKQVKQQFLGVFNFDKAEEF